MKLRISKLARRKAEFALDKRESLPKSKKFGLSKSEAKRQGVSSGVERAKQIINSNSLSIEDAKRVAAFYQRFKNKSSPRAEGALDLWGGRQFGRKAVKFVRDLKED